MPHSTECTLQETLLDARRRGETQSPFALFAACLSEIGVVLPEQNSRAVSLERAREEWLRRLRSAGRSASTLSAYRVALDDLLDFLDRSGSRSTMFSEETIVAHLTDYRRRARPACATYYRRFMLLRRFFRWLSRRAGTPDPFLDLEPPRKPQQEADWLTRKEFERLLQAASYPRRRRPGLAERDRLVLLTLVATGLRRSELLALDWRDLDLDPERPSFPSAAANAASRAGSRSRPRSQASLPAVARPSRRTPTRQSSAGSKGSGCSEQSSR